MRSRPSTCFIVFLAAAWGGCGTGAVDTSRDAAAPVPGEATPRENDVADAAQVVTANHKHVAAVEQRPDDWFEDVTSRSGVAFTHRNGREGGRFYLIESHGGGAALLDFDLDRDVDLFVTGGGTISCDANGQIGGRPSALFRNEGSLRFVDVTAAGGFSEPPGYSQGCAVTDFNADGFPDLLVSSYGRTRLYANRGDGSFGEIPDWARPAREGYATAAAFGDLDRDGFPDLLLAFYGNWTPETDKVCYGPNGDRDMCGPTSYAGTTCQFYHNSGDGSFDDWSQQVGMQGNARGLGVVAADLNGDGWVDFFIASDESPNQLYLGGADLPLHERAQLAGVALGEWGQPVANMGIAIGDYNGDGLPDMFITTFDNEDSSLYRNLGQGLFAHAMTAAGLAGFSRMHVKFGTALTDFDGDGWLDLLVLNGSPIYSTGASPFRQHPELFRNLAGRRFQDVSRDGGTYFQEVHSGRGLAIGDIDDDGAPDIVTVQMNDPVQILRNRKTPKNYVRVELRARRGEPDATGARISVEYEGRRLVQFATRGEGYLSQFDPRLIFPAAPDSEFVDVIVAWPGRGHEVFRRLAVRQTHLLIEGRGAAIDE